MKLVENKGRLKGFHLKTNDDRTIHIPSGHLGDFVEAVESAMGSQTKSEMGDYHGNGKIKVEGKAPGFWDSRHRVELVSIPGSYYLKDRSATLDTKEAREAVDAVYSFIENKALERGYIKQMKELGNRLD